MKQDLSDITISFLLAERMLCLCLALLCSVLHLFFVTMAVSIPHCVVKSDTLSPEEDRFREDYDYEAPRISSRQHRLGAR